jgi:UDP-N-acetylglucosamine/UDP-N-acetylgalactosamine diphosphorylase
LAGGEGSRLGCKDPKGMFDPKIPGVASIFELFVKKVKKLNQIALKKFGLPIPSDGSGPLKLVVMTNDNNYDTITEFFKQHNYFGFKSMIFFPQYLSPPIPAIDLDGKIVL